MLRSWLRTLVDSKSRASRPGRSTRTGKSPRRLQLEILEDRLIPAVHTWTGGTNNLWSNGGNWTRGAPLAGESNLQLRFPSGTQHLANLNDIQNLSVQEIVFSGTGYVLDGVPLVALGDGATITNTGTNNNVKFKVELQADLLDATHTFDIATNTTLTLAGVISGASGITILGNNLTKTGGGKLVLSNQNTYLGPTNLKGGTLELTTNYALSKSTA